LDRPLQDRQHVDAFQQHSHIIQTTYGQLVSTFIIRLLMPVVVRLDLFRRVVVGEEQTITHKADRRDSCIFVWHRLWIEANNPQTAAQSTSQATRKNKVARSVDNGPSKAKTTTTAMNMNLQRHHLRRQPSRPCTRRSYSFCRCGWRLTYCTAGSFVYCHHWLAISPWGCWCRDRTVWVWAGWSTLILSILGEVGLVLLLVQAGLAMDLHVLQQVGNAGHGHGAARIGLADHQLATFWSTRYWALTPSRLPWPWAALVRVDQYRLYGFERVVVMWRPRHFVGVWRPRHPVGSTRRRRHYHKASFVVRRLPPTTAIMLLLRRSL
jgi:hypothetical protein